LAAAAPGALPWLRHARATAGGGPARRGDAAEVVGTALTAAATGRGRWRVVANPNPAGQHDPQLATPRPPASGLAAAAGVDHAAALDPELLASLHPRPTALGDALAAAVHDPTPPRPTDRPRLAADRRAHRRPALRPARGS